MEIHGRTAGRLDCSAAARAPMLLLEVFRVLEHAEWLRREEEDENRRRTWQRGAPR